MPFFLAVVLGMYGGLALFIALNILCAPFNLMVYTINQQRVSGLDFLRAYGLYEVLAGSLAGIVAYGLYAQKPWGRDAVMQVWILTATATVVWNLWYGNNDGAIRAGVNFGLFAAFLGWYLYLKASVRSYFSVLDRSDSKAETTPDVQSADSV